jgi:uncharacterized protein YyaL (SSP411 family)
VRLAAALGLFGIFVGMAQSRGEEPAAAGPASATIAWQPWSDSVFSEAKREHKFVLLDLEAIWCHWCHVMDRETYADPKIIALINSHYIAVRVDQDSRPDLANRYENYGWPATVVYNADAGEIVKRQGFLPPGQMQSMLQAIIDDPTPGPSVTNEQAPGLSGVTPASDTETDGLRRQLISNYDFTLGGWSTSHRFLDWDNVEWALVRGQQGDAQAGAIARQMLAAESKLIDPVWGGVYQYSIDDWDHPHFEKLIQMQAENLRIYSLAYAWLRDPAYLQAAQKIDAYVRAFLTGPDGVVSTSQDADLVPGQPAEAYFKLGDAARRRLGIPRIDRHIYARENGWFIQARVALYRATGDSRQRDDAVSAAHWIVQNRGLPGGGFCHGDNHDAPLYLGDTLAMGRAFLALYAATADPAWLTQAETAAAFIRANFPYSVQGQPIGFATATKTAAVDPFAPSPEFDENVALARFANLLFHYSSLAADEEMARTALRFCAAPQVITSRHGYVGGVLLAQGELGSDPLHVVVIGSKRDPAALRLFLAAVFHPSDYEQLEWFDRRDPPPGSDISLYPLLPNPAAYLCAHHACSSPVSDEHRLVALIDKQRQTAITKN